LEKLDSLPLMKSGYSLVADMKMGWRPDIRGKVLPIPFQFDMEDEYFALNHWDLKEVKKAFPTIYTGWRPADSIKMYRQLLSNKD